MTMMNNDTIPSQLSPVTIPSALRPMESSTPPRNLEASGYSPALKWVLAAAGVGALYFLSR